MSQGSKVQNAAKTLNSVRGNIQQQARRGRQSVLNMRLHEAVRTGNETRVHKALAAGGDPNIRIGNALRHPKKDPTALAHALMHGNFDIADTLLEAGADPNAEQPYRDNLLFLLASHGNRRSIQSSIKLIEHGADVQYFDETEGNKVPTYLHLLAVRGEKTELAKCALLHGATDGFRNSVGETAEDILDGFAQQAGDPRQGMLWTLRLHRLAPGMGEQNLADLRKTNAKGFCALDHWQCWDNYAEVQTKLKSQGLPPLKASDLLTPLGGEEKGALTNNRPARIEALLPSCPSLIEALCDRELWEGESLHHLRAIKQALPDGLQAKFPYHNLRMQLADEHQQNTGRGR